MLLAYQKAKLKVSEHLLDAAQVVLGSTFIALCAQIKIPLYFTPVPLTIQTMAVMLIGALLGSRKGALAALCYLVQGCMGLPVFAGGAFGAIHLFGPTGGYLMGYILQAFVIGYLIEKKLPVFGALLTGLFLQLLLGSLFLGYFVGFESCLTLGFYPFILGEILKASSVTLFLKKMKRSVS